MKRVYICSPLRAADQTGLEENIANARRYMRLISEILGCKAVAPHAYLPQFLDDNIPEERKIALDFGLAYLKICHGLIFCGEVSEGMAKEIAEAIQLDIPIQYLCKDCIDALSAGDPNRISQLKGWYDALRS